MLLAGIFVGGRGSRMGGRAKGLLERDGEPLVLRTWRLLETAGASPVLVGRRPEYAKYNLETIDDLPEIQGPLAGLLALLERGAPALAIACDMPRLTTELLRALVDAPPAPIVAPRHDRFWEPLVARYDPSVLPIARRLAAAGERRLQKLCDEAGAVPLACALEVLEDWDLPEDVARGTREA